MMIYQLLSQHLDVLVWSLVASSMVIFGTSFNHWSRKILKPLPFFPRFLAFMVLCAVGYGWLTWFLAQQIVKALRQADPLVMSVLVTSGFIAAAMLARKRRLI